MTHDDASPLLLTRTTPQRGHCLVRVRGDMDYETSGILLDLATEVLAQRGLRRLTLDCGELDHCDSMGLSTLIMVDRKAYAARVRFELVNRRPALERLLDITGADTVFGTRSATRSQTGHRSEEGEPV